MVHGRDRYKNLALVLHHIMSMQKMLLQLSRTLTYPQGTASLKKAELLSVFLVSLHD